jgi:hypothetical protein
LLRDEERIRIVQLAEQQLGSNGDEFNGERHAGASLRARPQTIADTRT